MESVQRTDESFKKKGSVRSRALSFLKLAPLLATLLVSSPAIPARAQEKVDCSKLQAMIKTGSEEVRFTSDDWSPLRKIEVYGPDGRCKVYDSNIPILRELNQEYEGPKEAYAYFTYSDESKNKDLPSGHMWYNTFIKMPRVVLYYDDRSLDVDFGTYISNNSSTIDLNCGSISGAGFGIGVADEIGREYVGTDFKEMVKPYNEVTLKGNYSVLGVQFGVINPNNGEYPFSGTSLSLSLGGTGSKCSVTYSCSNEDFKGDLLREGKKVDNSLSIGYTDSFYFSDSNPRAGTGSLGIFVGGGLSSTEIKGLEDTGSTASWNCVSRSLSTSQMQLGGSFSAALPMGKKAAFNLSLTPTLGYCWEKRSLEIEFAKEDYWEEYAAPSPNISFTTNISAGISFEGGDVALTYSTYRNPGAKDGGMESSIGGGVRLRIGGYGSIFRAIKKRAQ